VGVGETRAILALDDREGVARLDLGEERREGGEGWQVIGCRSWEHIKEGKQGGREGGRAWLTLLGEKCCSNRAIVLSIGSRLEFKNELLSQIEYRHNRISSPLKEEEE